MKMKRKIKDSVFTYLFRQPEYTMQLYQALHPEDKDIKPEDLKIVTLENVLSNIHYNDLGFEAREILIVLMEAQSSFTKNVVLRMFLYLASSYKEHTIKEKMDLYSSRTVKIPRPELYMIYTGDKKDVPDTLHLSDLYDGEGDVDLTVHILRANGTHDIIDQYVQFCQITDEQRKKYGYTKQAIEETIRTSIERDVLASFLRDRKKEVIDIMDLLFSQEEITAIHEYNLVKDAREEGYAALVRALQQLGLDRATVQKTVMQQFSLSSDVAAQKVEQYWVTM